MKSEIKSDINLTVTVRLNGGEIRALDALAGYGTDEFLKVFYQKMGKHYLKPHEGGVRSLFARVKGLRFEMNRVDEMRACFKQIGRGIGCY